MLSRSCSYGNSGVCTPTTSRPSALYASDHARTYGSVRSQLMHVNVQNWTSTTRPRVSSSVSGSELSHAVAAPKPGERVIASAQRLERRPNLGGEELRLLPRGEVSALFGLVEVDDVRIAR